MKTAYNLEFISVKRIYNLFKLLIGFYLSRILRRPVILGDPFAISIELTTSCQLKCPECPTGSGTLLRKKGFMALHTFTQIISSLPENTFYLNLYLQGEPFLHPQIIEMIKFANSKKLFTCIATNAQLIDDKTAEHIVRSGLSKIIISLDGLTQQTYSQYRINGSVDKVFNAIEALNKAKTKLKSSAPYLVVQMIAFEHNQHEIVPLKIKVSPLVDHIEIKTAQFYEKDHYLVFPSTKKKLTRYIPKNGKLLLINRTYQHCWRIFSSMAVTWDTIALPCCFDKDATFSMGNISSTTVRYIWRSKEFNAFRSHILNHRSSISICQNCTEGHHWYI